MTTSALDGLAARIAAVSKTVREMIDELPPAPDEAPEEEGS